jgi:hypothetical protein
MTYVMFQYDRPTDTHNWNTYSQQVRDWIAQLLQAPGTVPFVAYRTADGTRPNTITLLEFHSVEAARQAVGSEPIKCVLDKLRSVGAVASFLLAERSPFTLELIRPD